MTDQTTEVAVRKARMRAAVADPRRAISPVIAAMEAGAGAEPVARTYRARDALVTRIAARRKGHAA